MFGQGRIDRAVRWAQRACSSRVREKSFNGDKRVVQMKTDPPAWKLSKTSTGGNPTRTDSCVAWKPKHWFLDIQLKSKEFRIIARSLYIRSEWIAIFCRSGMARAGCFFHNMMTLLSPRFCEIIDEVNKPVLCEDNVFNRINKLLWLYMKTRTLLL